MPLKAKKPAEELQPRERGALLTFQELMELPPLSFLVEETLVQGSFALMYGAPKAGKTFLALDMALSVAAGRTWQGRETQRGHVLYVSAEGTGGLPQRVTAWIESARLDDLERKRLTQNFRVWRNPVNLCSQDETAGLIGAIRDEQLDPVLIVVDTLARCFVGNENSAEDMGKFIAGVDSLRDAFPGATVLVIHHQGKDEEKGARGSTALRGAIDTGIRLHTHKRDSQIG
ncbi:AAA family ATPase [Fodinicurvata halophila]|uniref:AAA family ATPase n=1 Tax=Fodinicurvata halophila TaxID=1419723 RepID=A0ABV8UQ95_9PROT